MATLISPRIYTMMRRQLFLRAFRLFAIHCRQFATRDIFAATIYALRE